MTGAAAYYRRLPEEVRRCLRPLAGLEELASFLPPRARQPIVRATEMGRRLGHLRRVRYGVRRLEGRAPNGAPLACVLACDELSARYWTQTLFATTPRVDVVGALGAFAAPRAAGSLDDAADLTLVQAPWPLARLARRMLQVPSWIPLWIPTDCPLDAIVTGDRSGRAARKNDVRRVERAGLVPRLVRDAATIERFHEEVYAPYVRGRFGALGVVLPRHAFRHARRHGWLLLLEDARGPRGGALLEPHGAELRVLAFAAVGGDAQVGVEAAYWHAIRFAVARGFARLALGTSRPVLTDGVLRYKRKWGARVGVPTTFDRFLLRVRDTSATRSVLTATPLVADRGDGALVGLVGCEGVDPPAQVARVDLPGLAEIRVAGDRVDCPAAPHSPVRPLHVATR
jgi:hypothetical protein